MFSYIIQTKDMLLRQAGFWEAEKTAPLLLLNKGFLGPDKLDEAFERASKWPQMVLTEKEIEDSKQPVQWINEEPSRIIIRDIERTFIADPHRKQLARVLQVLEHRFKDYSQGMNFVVSFLMLFLKEETVLAMIEKLNKDNQYFLGYWKHEAFDFARDAYVFDYLLQKRLPEAHAHIAKNNIFPETYCQKWFTTMCIHVLPYDALFEIFDLVFQHGTRFMFKFGLSLVDHIFDNIKTRTDATTIFAYLRLDATTVKFADNLPLQIVRKASTYDITEIETDEGFAAVRTEMYNLKLRARVEAQEERIRQLDEEKRRKEEKKAKQAEAGSDADEISETDEDFDTEDEDEEDGIECQICNNMVPEKWCKDCKLLICGMCHEAKKKPHAAGHKVQTADQDMIDRVAAELAQELEKVKL